MKFDLTVNLGNIITVAAFIITLYKFHLDNIRRFERMEIKIDLIWKWFDGNIVNRHEQNN